MISARIIPVIVSSAGDVAERGFIDRAIMQWNNINRGLRGVMLLPLLWERDVPGIQGCDTQEQVNKWIVDVADIGIVVFWGRYGAGNTEIELRRMLECKKVVIVYRCARNSSGRRDSRLTRLFGELRGRGLLREYKTNRQLEGMLFRDLSAAVSDVLGQPPSGHLRLGFWLQVKEASADRPYSIVHIGKNDGQLEIAGRSYHASGRRGFSWPRSDSRIFECGGDRLFHFYMADGSGQLVTGATFYDFPAHVGYYYQSASGGVVPTARVEFDLCYLDMGAMQSFYGISAAVRPGWESALISRIHRNRISPRVILTGGTGSGKTTLAKHLAKAEAGLTLVRESAIDVIGEWKRRHGRKYRKLRNERGLELQAEILKRQAQRELAALPVSSKSGVQPMLMDRSGVDCIAYARQSRSLRDGSDELALHVEKSMFDYAAELRRYTHHVFVLDTLKSFSKRSESGRTASRSSSEQMGAKLEGLYMELGFHCTRLGELSPDRERNVALRAAMVREVIEGARDHDPFARGALISPRADH